MAAITFTKRTTVLIDGQPLTDEQVEILYDALVSYQMVAARVGLAKRRSTEVHLPDYLLPDEQDSRVIDGLICSLE